MRHPPGQHLPRHPHDHGFAALVISGGYVEAGDTGRHRMAPGDVLLHRAWESHLDSFDRRGAEVLVLRIDDEAAAALCGRCADVDAVVRLAERDSALAAERLLAELSPVAAAAADWPDLLATAIRAEPSLRLAEWAEDAGLCPGSVSRGFRQVFGTTPAAYRLAQRTRLAVVALSESRAPLSAIALDCGFADQAHMCRAVGRLAHMTPAALRREHGAGAPAVPPNFHNI